MKVKLKSKNGDVFYRLGKALTPDEWVEFDLEAEAAKRGTGAEQLLGQLMKSSLPVKPKREPDVKDERGNLVAEGRVIPRTGGGAVDLEPTDKEAELAVARIKQRRAEWEAMTTFQRVAAAEVMNEQNKLDDEARRQEAIAKAKAWAGKQPPAPKPEPRAATGAR